VTDTVTFGYQIATSAMHCRVILKLRRRVVEVPACGNL
jgi:hypothetical protein